MLTYNCTTKKIILVMPPIRLQRVNVPENASPISATVHHVRASINEHQAASKKRSWSIRKSRKNLRTNGPSRLKRGRKSNCGETHKMFQYKFYRPGDKVNGRIKPITKLNSQTIHLSTYINTGNHQIYVRRSNATSMKCSRWAYSNTLNHYIIFQYS